MIRKISVGFLLLLSLAMASVRATVPGDIGLERGPNAIVLSRGDYTVAPQDDSTPLILMIESVKPEKAGEFVYVFRSLGFESGDYKLSDYLVHPDGTPAAELGDLSLKVSGLLPPDHKGRLSVLIPSSLPWFGGYRAAVASVIGLWAAALPALIFIGRKRKTSPVAATVLAKPTREELMRPLVIAASEGRLDVSGRAELERLMTGHWRETFAMNEGRMSEILAAMRQHHEAGALMIALERWLHDPRGIDPGEIETLLAPYGRDSGVRKDGGAV